VKSFLICVPALHQIMEKEMGGACSTHGRNEKIHEASVGKPGRSRRNWDDNIEMDHKDIEYGL